MKSYKSHSSRNSHGQKHLKNKINLDPGMLEGNKLSLIDEALIANIYFNDYKDISPEKENDDWLTRLIAVQKD